MNLRNLNIKLKKIKIELTDLCPLNCLHCSSNSSIEGKIFLDLDYVVKILEEAKKNGVEKIIFSGGEPLLYPSILDLILICSNLGIETILYSTGINSLNINEVSYNIFKELRKRGLSKFIFTLHSDKEKIHEYITRVSGSFKITLSAIEESINNGLETELHFVPMRFNFNSLEGLVYVAKNLGVKKISILRFVPHGRGILINNIKTLTKKENIFLRNIIKKIRKKNSIIIRLGSPYNIFFLDKNTKCNAGVDQMIINPRGEIFPCDAFKNINPEDLGIYDDHNSIFKHSISEIWIKSKYLDYVRSILTKNVIEPCKNCPQLKKCNAGCLAQKIINNCIIYGKDPDCIIRGDWKC